MMTRTTTVVSAISAFGFFGTAALHGSALPAITKLAADIPSELAPLMPALWIAFSLDMMVLGMMVAWLAWKKPRHGAVLLAFAAVQPFGAAILQLIYLGFIPPTAILLGLGTLTLIAAWLFHHDSAPSN